MSVIKKLSGLEDSIYDAAEELAEAGEALDGMEAGSDELLFIEKASEFVRDGIIPKMDVLRAAADEAEALTAASFWPFPTYGKLLFGV